jgi:hypothetical protein
MSPLENEGEDPYQAELRLIEEYNPGYFAEKKASTEYENKHRY